MGYQTETFPVKMMMGSRWTYKKKQGAAQTHEFMRQRFSFKPF